MAATSRAVVQVATPPEPAASGLEAVTTVTAEETQVVAMEEGVAAEEEVAVVVVESELSIQVPTCSPARK